MILLHLDYANLPPAAPITPQVARDAIRRLEMAALSHNSEGFAQEIEKSLHIDRVLARRLIEDESGEPILVDAGRRAATHSSLPQSGDQPFRVAGVRAFHTL